MTSSNTYGDTIINTESISLKEIVRDETDKSLWKLSFNIPEGKNKSDRLGKIELIAKSLITLTPIAHSSIQTNYMQAGAVGPISNAGAIAYPAGYWDPNTNYEKGSNTIPYVYYNDKYYILNNTKSSCKGITPGTNSEYWVEMKSFEAIFTNFIMANNATLGSPNGAVVYDNFLYSQKGLDKYNNLCHFSSITSSIFKSKNVTINNKTETISGLYGTFKPNFCIDNYMGSITCNKLCEQYDYFTPILMKNYQKSEKPIYINTYFMDLNKSHNISITPRGVIIDTTYAQYTPEADPDNDGILDDPYAYAYSCYKATSIERPGVVVLPKYDATDPVWDNDGIRICISYPVHPNSGYEYAPTKYNEAYVEGNIIPTFNTASQKVYRYYNPELNLTELNISTKDVLGNVYKDAWSYDYIIPDEITNGGYLNSEGYILVCADPNIFDISNYKDGEYLGQKDANCFVWNGWKTKFILLNKGSELLVRSNLVKYNKRKLVEYYTDGAWGTEEIDLPGIDNSNYIIHKYESEMPETSSKAKCQIISKPMGYQWIIENSSSFLPVPVHIQIDNMNHDDINEQNICTFKCGIPGRYPGDFIGLGTGFINYETTDKGSFHEYDPSQTSTSDPTPSGNPSTNLDDLYGEYWECDTRENRPVFFSGNMGTMIYDGDGTDIEYDENEEEFVRNIYGNYVNPMIVNLNINESVNEVEDKLEFIKIVDVTKEDADSHNFDFHDCSPVYTSTIISKWGVFNNYLEYFNNNDYYSLVNTSQIPASVNRLNYYTKYF